MSEGEVMKCPKCGGEMEEASSLSDYGSVGLRKHGSFWRREKIVPFYCKKCGYIELYRK